MARARRPRTSTRLRRAAALLLVMASIGVTQVVATPVAGAAATITAGSTSPVSIANQPSVGVAAPYPSSIDIGDIDGTITAVQVTLTGLTHTYPGDLDLMLVGPTGANLLFLSDAGSGRDVIDGTLAFVDGAPAATSAPLVSGTTYGPTNVSDTGGGDDVFPAPAPAPSASTTFAAAFGGTDPRGVWSLYGRDDFSGLAGQLAGWTLSVTAGGQQHDMSSAGAPIALPGPFATSPYPTTVDVSTTGVVTSVEATLTGVTHANPDDLDVLLVGPTGRSVFLISDAGGGTMTSADLTFSDAAAAPIPDSTSVGSGTYQPFNVGFSDYDYMPPPAPVEVASATLTGAFAGTDPNGQWRLFVFDDTPAVNGSMDGWSVTITTKLQQTVAFASTPATPAVGTTYAVAATVDGSAGTAVFSIDPSTTNDACTLVGTVVTFQHVGSCVVAATVPEDETYVAGTTTQTITVPQGAQPIVFVPAQPATVPIGQSYEPGATGGATGNPVVLSIDPSTTNAACNLTAGVLTYDHAGTCVLAADQEGSVDYLPGEATLEVEVLPDPQTVAFLSEAPSPAHIWESYTVDAVGGESGNPVTYAVDPATTNGACTVDGTTVSFVHAGTCVVAASQAGAGDLGPGLATQTIAVAKTAQDVVFTSPEPADPRVGNAAPLVATGGASGNPLTFAVDPATTNSACTVEGTTVAFVHVGTCVVAAEQAGGADFAPGRVTRTTLVTQGPQTVSFTSSAPARPRVGNTFTVAAAGGASGNPVTFSVGSGSTNGACTVTGTTVTLAGLGTCVVRADQAGGADHLAAIPSTQTFEIVPSTPVITATATSTSRPNASGYYRTPVRVAFTCAADGSALTTACPAPVTLTTSTRGAVVTRSIAAADGGSGSATVVVRLDRTAPKVTVKGIKKGRTYRKVPKVTCTATDAHSGVASCKTTVKVRGTKIRYTATGLDRAGNRTVVRSTAILKKKRT
ncbi:proprotein convertase P-domain-containing protein [Nocardioides lijunqiniae]|uniref:proprotein convertase P-domain-containing protein n=1 Tax=Nocardioides lijunqiniae TaxID=2760832 RepID=UPI001877D5AD|nr:proprotein convertase P-domain-containing protein [Nocardioides lijunqiniae]